MRRTDLLTRVTAVAIAAAALLCVGLLSGVADGKKKHKGKGGKVTVVSSQQQAILDAGAITVKVKGGKGKRVVVDGIQSSGSAPLTKPKKAKPGKAMNLALTASGRTAMGSCSVEGLRGRFVKGKKKGKKSAAAPITPLVRNLAACGGSPPKGAKCDPFDPSLCMQPFPNDYFTVADPSTDTGRRLDFQADAMPQNKAGVPIDPTDFNRADGFSPGSAITVKIPEVETQQAFDNTGFVPLTDPGAYADENQPAVVIDADTGDRQPIFAELDANPNHYQPGDTADVNLIIRPTINFLEGHRYIVALRNLRDASDNPVDAADGVPRLSRQPGHDGPGGRGPPAAHGGPAVDAGGGRDPHGGTSTWPGTSRSRASTASPGAPSRFAMTRCTNWATTRRATARSTETRRRSMITSV